MTKAEQPKVVSQMYITPGIYAMRVIEDAVRVSQRGDVLVHYHSSKEQCLPVHECKRFRKGEELSGSSS